MKSTKRASIQPLRKLTIKKEPRLPPRLFPIKTNPRPIERVYTVENNQNSAYESAKNWFRCVDMMPKDQANELVSRLREDETVRDGLTKLVKAALPWLKTAGEITVDEFMDGFEPTQWPPKDIPGFEFPKKELDALTIRPKKEESPYFGLAASMARGMAGGA
jgi:hypothetical protein